MKQVSERLGPRLAEICRAYDRLEDWEDCRPSKDASRPGTWDHNHSPFSTGTTLKRQGRGCPVLLVRPRAAWSDTGIEGLPITRSCSCQKRPYARDRFHAVRH